MDLYITNHQNLRKLIAKRQSPCTQAFKQQPSNLTIKPKTKVNPGKKACFSNQKQQKSSNTSSTLKKCFFSTKRIFNNYIVNNFCPVAPFEEEKDKDNKDLDLFDKVTKKIKTSSLGVNSRKNSFDGSEHSTTCDGHSEGNLNNEVQDFISSPLKTQTSTNSTIFKNDTEISVKNENIFEGSNVFVNVPNFTEIKNQPQEIKNAEIPENVFPEESFRFKCEFRHSFRIYKNKLDQGKCRKCEELLGKCQSFAEANSGSCLNDKFEDTIRYICCKGHEWNVSYRNFNNGWCRKCEQEKKEELKKKCEEERKRRQRIEEEYQKKLFEEARRKVMNNIFQGIHSEGIDLEYLQKIEQEVETLALDDTKKFMENKESINGHNITFQQAFQVYKVLRTSEDTLKKYLSSLDIETVKSEFRRIVKLIHPDKNRHPNAGNAFQKIHKVYVGVIGEI